MSAGDTLYLKIGKNIVVTDRRVSLGDVAKMECTDQAALLDKIGGSRLMRLKNEPHLGYSTTH